MEREIESQDLLMWNAHTNVSMNIITAIMVLKTPPDKKLLFKIIEDRLSLFERFRCKVTDTHGKPQWAHDDDFDINSHIHHFALPQPGDDQALQEMMESLMSKPLDCAKPLWQIHMIENYQGGFVLLWRIHHVIADGMALIKVVFSLTGKSAEDSLHLPPASTEDADLPPEKLSSKIQRWALQSEKFIKSAREWWQHPEDWIESIRKNLQHTIDLGKVLLDRADDPASKFYKGKLSVLKTPVWTQDALSVADLKTIGHHYKATVNDMLLCLVAGGIRYHLKKNNIDPKEGITVAAPVNMRPHAGDQRLNNKVGSIFINLPVHLSDPAERLSAIHEHMEDIKSSVEPVLIYNIVELFADVTTKGLENTVTGMLGSNVTAIVTNVPGPREYVYIAGCEIADMMFWVPQSEAFGIGISMMSYCGKARIGIVTDPAVVKHPEWMIEGIVKEYELLKKIVSN